ncbi:MAG: malic enzyme-like NAD(P)-binding protein, partial [Candidatus Puniceispirillaceae bacterium]
MIDKNDPLNAEALAFHAQGRPGKFEINATKPLTSQRDLSLAYSPGVAAPCMEIAADADAAYDYTSKGNVIAVISNGTAVLGLGDIGAAAAKPVMEGKAVLFKKFADIDGIDLELDTTDPEKFIETVAMLAPTFGGVNLEDIKAPECFEIERRIAEATDIPVMHDDQHGTAIISAAALLNAAELQEKALSDLKVVVIGAGASAIACANHYVAIGVNMANITLVDSQGIITK